MDVAIQVAPVDVEEELDDGPERYYFADVLPVGADSLDDPLYSTRLYATPCDAWKAAEAWCWSKGHAIASDPEE